MQDKINGKTVNYAGLKPEEAIRFVVIETHDKGERLTNMHADTKIPIYRVATDDIRSYEIVL